MLQNFKKAYRETDKLFFSLCILLSVFGIVMVASASHRTVESGGLLSRDAIVMIGALVLGIIIALVISFIDYDLIYKLWPVIALGSIFLMLLLFTPLGVAPDARSDARSCMRAWKARRRWGIPAPSVWIRSCPSFPASSFFRNPFSL